MHPPKRRALGVRRLGASLTATALIGASLALSAPSAAAADPENFSKTTPGTFSVEVPTGVCAVTVEARGGAGGSVVTGVANTNGAGADITVKYAVVAGQTFSGTVGGGGQPSTGTGAQTGNGGPNAGVGGSGVGSGGRGGTVGSGSSHAGAGGGGGTLVQLDGEAAIYAGGGGASSGGHATNGGFGGNAGLPDAVGTAKAGSNGLDGFDNPNSGSGSGTPRGGEGGQTTDAGDGGVHTTNSSLSGFDGSGRDGGNGGNDSNYDSGGGGGGGYTGGGGGASTTSNGSGTAVAGGNAGGGGGGGSSLVTAEGSPSLVSAVAGPRLGTSHDGSGADGFVTLTWELCSFDLEVDKSVSGPDQTGLTTWTVTVTNNGPGDMAATDTVTLTDTLPGGADTTVITELDTPSGVTCDVDEGDPMQSPIECSALAVDETITIVYTQTLTSVGKFANTAEVKDSADQTNNSSTATTEVTPPEADPGTTTGPQGQEQRWVPEITDGTFPVDCDATLTLVGAVGGVVTVAGVGTYSVDGCEIVFTPEPDFVGEAPPVTYQVSDSQGNTATSTYTPTVTEVVPIANDDTTTGRPNQEQSVNPLLNDAPGDPAVPLDPSSLTLLDADGDPAVEVTVPEGVYTLEEGKIVFTPNLNYFGPVTPVDYRVADTNGTTAEAVYQPVIEVEPPETDDGETTGIQGAQQSWTPTPTAGQDFPIVADSLTLLDSDGDPVDEIVVDGVGTYTVVGTEIVFQPEPQFVGDAPTVDYRVTDEGGQHAEGTYTPKVTAVTPVAVDDSSVGRVNESQSVAPLANDAPGHADVPLVPFSLTLLDAGGNPAATVTVPEGVYTIDDTDPTAPLIVFTPNEDYFGTPTPVTYRVADANGTTATAVYQPDVVVDPPATNDGATTGPQGVAQSWEPTPVAGQDFDIDWSTLTLLDSDGDPVDEIVVAGVGTYTVVGTEIVFQPEPQFVGDAPTVDYRISDEGGQPAEGTYTPSVTAVVPVANDDTTTGRPNQEQSVNPLLNDEPGDPAVPLDPSSLTLLDADGDPAVEVTVPEGVYTIVDGKIVFTPNLNYFGPVTPVDYRVADVNGTTAEAVYQPVIEVEPPTTDNGETTGPQGVPQSWTPTPTAGQDFPIVADSLTLLDSEGDPVDEIVVDGVGTYTVVSGEIVFTPVPTFIGMAPTVDYRVTDEGGQHAAGTYTPSVTPVTPIANDDSSSGWWNTPQSVDPLVNDEAGDPAVPLDPSSLTLLDADGDPADEVTVPEGVYTIVDGKIVFTPNRDYTGMPTPVDYRISDVNGTPAEATYQPEVRGPEDSQDLVETRVCGSTVTFDTVGEVPDLDPSSVRLRDANGDSVLELVVDGEGTWKVDPATGKVTFTPEGCLDEDPTPVDWEGTLTDGTPIIGTLTVLYTEPEDDEDLAYTGFNPLLPAGLAGLLLTAGLVLVGIRRRGGLVS